MKKLNLSRKQLVTFIGSGVVIFALIFTGSIIWSNSKTDKEVDYRNYVTGLRNWTVELDTKDVDYLSGVSWDKDEIKNVTVDSKAVDLSKEGNYDLTYTIDVIKKDVKDIKVAKKVKVVSKEEAKEEAEKGEEVATQDGIQNKKSEDDLKKAEESKKKETASNTNKQSNSSNGSTAKSDGGKKNSTSNSESKPSTPKEDKPAHKHNWVLQYKTVHHDAQTKQERYVVKEAWVEEVPQQVSEMHTFCDCGVDLTEFEKSGGSAHEHVKSHALKHESTRTYEAPVWKPGTPQRIEHPAEYGTRTVIVKEAWDEQVPDGYKCSECGARK